MATLHVSFCGGIQNGAAKDPVGYEALGTSGQNAATNSNPGGVVVFLYSDVAHFVKVGAAATATNGLYLPPSQTIPLTLDSGDEINAIIA